LAGSGLGRYPINAIFKITDKRRATYLLEVREQGGHKFFHFIRVNKLRYLFLICVLGGISTYFALTDCWGACIILSTYIFGVLICDWSWLMGMKKSWPFVSRITNWDEVKKAADKESQV
jgi:hypothetical protein